MLQVLCFFYTAFPGMQGVLAYVCDTHISQLYRLQATQSVSVWHRLRTFLVLRIENHRLPCES
jgi:hypothetical protein